MSCIYLLQASEVLALVLVLSCTSALLGWPCIVFIQRIVNHLELPKLSISPDGFIYQRSPRRLASPSPTRRTMMELARAHFWNWFSEWPNARRPLSTTWPWTIKPSLAVLWGVCWMFHPRGHPHIPTSAEPELDIFAAQAVGLGPHTEVPGVRHPVWPEAAHDLGFAGLHQANAPNPGATATHFGAAPPDPSQPGLLGDPAHAGASHGQLLQSYISDSTAPPGALLSESSSSYWNYAAHSPQRLIPLYSPEAVRPQAQGSNIITPGILPSQPFGATQPESLSRKNSESQEQLAHPRQGSTLTTLRTQVSQLQRRNMQDYPSPQLSDASGRQDVSPFGRVMTSPSVLNPKSPSISSSSSSPHSVGREREPARNSNGELYCDHSDCINDPPTFTRKSEWSKHMDKHIRPYVCEEPSCENIRGFTYSGGLLRHQREVHGQHGGPKASCFCPFPDCNRSAAGGHGFSRRENLAEHLRRVHRQGSSPFLAQSGSVSNLPATATTTQTPSISPLTPIQPAALGHEGPSYQPPRPSQGPAAGKPQKAVQYKQPRKRKRPGGSSAPSSSSSQNEISRASSQHQEQPSIEAPVGENEWQLEINKLRREIQEKDERMLRMESMLVRLQNQVMFTRPALGRPPLAAASAATHQQQVTLQQQQPPPPTTSAPMPPFGHHESYQ